MHGPGQGNLIRIWVKTDSSNAVQQAAVRYAGTLPGAHVHQTWETRHAVDFPFSDVGACEAALKAFAAWAPTN